MSTNRDSIWHLTVAEFRDSVASPAAVPGGGSVAVIVGILGLGLISKGIAVSLRHAAPEASRHGALLELSTRITASIQSLAGYADADASAFRHYLGARTLPATNEKQKAARRSAMDDALLKATTIPLDAAAGMCRGMEMAEAASKLANAHVLSDIAAGTLLLKTAVSSVLLNVDMNLGGISDLEVGDELRSLRDKWESASRPFAEAVQREFQRRVIESETN